MQCPFFSKKSRWRTFSAVLGVLLWISFLAPTRAEGIPIENQGFEVDYDKDLFPDGWEVRDEATLSLKEQSLEGAWCAALQPLTGKHRARVQSSSFPLKPGKMYVVSAWKRSLKEVPVGLSLELVDASGRSTDAWSSRSLSTLFWSPLKLLLSTPPEASLARLTLEVGRSGSSEGTTVYWDHCEIAEAQTSKAVSGQEWRPVPLSKQANCAWDDEALEGLSSLPRGMIRMAQVPFTLPREGSVFLHLALDSKSPSSGEAAVPLDMKASTLYFLHCTRGSEQLGATIGTYEILFADGQKEEIPLRFDREIGSFKHPHGGIQGPMVWFSDSETNWPVGVNMMPWENPRPESALQSLVVRSSSADAPILLLGLTAFEGPNLLRSDIVTSVGRAQEQWLPTRLGPWEDSPVVRGSRFQGMDRVVPPLRDEYGLLLDDLDRPIRLFGGSLQILSETAEPFYLQQTLFHLKSVGCNLVHLRIPDRWSEASLPLLVSVLERVHEEGMVTALSPLPSMQTKGQGLRFWMGDPSLYRESRKYARWLKASLKREGLLNHVALWIVDVPPLLEALDGEDRDILRTKWNRWLQDRYKGRGRLYDTWSQPSGESALGEHEDPAEGTVLFPNRLEPMDEVTIYGSERARRKQMDVLEFLRECSEETGNRIPRLTAGLSGPTPLVWLEHPYATYGAHPLPKGVLQGVKLYQGRGKGWPGWTAGYLSCLGVSSASPFLPPLSLAGTPLVVQIPSEGFLRTGAPQTLARAAYGAFHGWDVLLVDIGEQSSEKGEGLLFEEAPFFPACAALFLRGDVKTAIRRTEVSLLDPPQAGGWWLQGWITGFADDANFVTPLTVHPGSQAPDSQLDRSVLLAWGPRLEKTSLQPTSSRRLLFLESAIENADPSTATRMLQSLHQGIELVRPPSLSLSFPAVGLLGPCEEEGSFAVSAPLCIRASSVPESALSVGLAPEEDLCLGTITGQWAILSGNETIRERKRSPELQFWVAALKEWGLVEEGASTVEKQLLFHSMGGELAMDASQGIFRIQTQNTLSITGHLIKDKTYAVGPLQIVSDISPCAAVLTRMGEASDAGETRWLLTACGETGTRGGTAFQMDTSMDPANRCPSWIWANQKEKAWRAAPFQGAVRFTGALSKGQLHVYPVLEDGSRGPALYLEAVDQGVVSLSLDGTTPSLLFEVVLDSSFGILARK